MHSVYVIIHFFLFLNKLTSKIYFFGFCYLNLKPYYNISQFTKYAHTLIIQLPIRNLLLEFLNILKNYVLKFSSFFCTNFEAMLCEDIQT